MTESKTQWSRDAWIVNGKTMGGQYRIEAISEDDVRLVAVAMTHELAKQITNEHGLVTTHADPARKCVTCLIHGYHEECNDTGHVSREVLR